MKKLFLILAATVVLLSCVAAKREDTKKHYKCEIIYETCYKKSTDYF